VKTALASIGFVKIMMTSRGMMLKAACAALECLALFATQAPDGHATYRELFSPNG
jgi:hypothetical protein